MRLYLLGDAAEKSVRYIVTIAPAGDADFVRMRTTWSSGPGVRPGRSHHKWVHGDDLHGRFGTTRGIPVGSRQSGRKVPLLHRLPQNAESRKMPSDAA